MVESNMGSKEIQQKNIVGISFVESGSLIIFFRSTFSQEVVIEPQLKYFFAAGATDPVYDNLLR